MRSCLWTIQSCCDTGLQSVTANPIGTVEVIYTWRWWDFSHWSSCPDSVPQPWENGIGSYPSVYPAKSDQEEKNIIITNAELTFHPRALWLDTEFEKHISKNRFLCSACLLCTCEYCVFSWVNTILLKAWIILSMAWQHDSSDPCHFVLYRSHLQTLWMAKNI